MPSSPLCLATCPERLLSSVVDVPLANSVTEFCSLTLLTSTVLAVHVCAACVKGAGVVILVGGIADDMNDDDDDDEVVVVGRTVVGRTVVGVGLSRHFRTPTSSSGQSSTGKIVLKNLFTVDSLLTL